LSAFNIKENPGTERNGVGIKVKSSAKVNANHIPDAVIDVPIELQYSCAPMRPKSRSKAIIPG
jgi:hypothetical protein